MSFFAFIVKIHHTRNKQTEHSNATFQYVPVKSGRDLPQLNSCEIHECLHVPDMHRTKMRGTNSGKVPLKQGIRFSFSLGQTELSVYLFNNLYWEFI